MSGAACSLSGATDRTDGVLCQRPSTLSLFAAAVGNRQDHVGPPVCCYAGLPCGDSDHVPGGCCTSSSVTVFVHVHSLL